MDMGDLLKLGANAFMNSKGSGDTGSNLDMDSVVSALSGLTGDSEEGGLDIGSVISKLTGGDSSGLMNMAQSWLGDGDNEPASSDSVVEMLGEDKIAEFAEKLGVSEEEAIAGLQDTLPQIIDKGSEGGSILDSIGGISGALNIAKKLFG